MNVSVRMILRDRWKFPKIWYDHSTYDCNDDRLLMYVFVQIKNKSFRFKIR